MYTRITLFSGILHYIFSIWAPIVVGTIRPKSFIGSLNSLEEFLTMAAYGSFQKNQGQLI